MNTVKLKNGKTVHEAVAGTTMVALRRLRDTDPVAFYELTCAAHDKSHAVFNSELATAIKAIGMCTEVRADRTLVIHEATRDVIVCATPGDPLQMELVSPLA